MDRNNRVPFSILALCILAGVVCLTVALISPNKPLPIDAPAMEFSAGRAMQDLEIIAREPHPMGVFQSHADVRAYLMGFEYLFLGIWQQKHQNQKASYGYYCT